MPGRASSRLSLSLCLAVLAGPVACLAAGMYEITDFSAVSTDYVYAVGINDQSQVAGTAIMGSLQAFLWRDGEGPVGSGAGLVSLRATGLNNRGQVVGWFSKPGDPTWLRCPFIWDTSFGLRDLGSLGGSSGAAWAINDLGAVVGTAAISTGDLHPFLWTSEAGMTDLEGLGLGSAWPEGINDGGWVVGSRPLPGGGQVAFAWKTGAAVIEMGALGGRSSVAFAVNNALQAVGVSQNASGQLHAFLWADGQAMIDLGTLGGVESTALAINDLGQVVGWAADAGDNRRAFLWSDGEMLDLTESLGPDGAGWVLVSARGINDRGQIIGTGLYGDEYREFLLTPLDSAATPEPTTLALLLLGAAAVVARRRR